MPASMSTASAVAQKATMAPTCSRRSPWRSTKAFCAPMATMSVSPSAKPVEAAAREAVVMPAMLPARAGPAA